MKKYKLQKIAFDYFKSPAIGALSGGVAGAGIGGLVGILRKAFSKYEEPGVSQILKGMLYGGSVGAAGGSAIGMKNTMVDILNRAGTRSLIGGGIGAGGGLILALADKRRKEEQTGIPQKMDLAPLLTGGISGGVIGGLTTFGSPGEINIGMKY